MPKAVVRPDYIGVNVSDYARPKLVAGRLIHLAETIFLIFLN